MAILTGFFLAAFLIINPLLNSVVKPKMVDSVNSREDHSLEINDISFSFFSNSVSINGINYIFDDNETKISVTAPEIIISSVPWVNLLTGGGLNFGTITIDNPLVNIEETTIERVIEKEEEEVDLVDRIRRALPEDHQYIEASRLLVNNGKIIRYVKEAGDSSYIKNFNFTLEEIVIDPDTSGSTLPLKIARSAELSAEDFFKLFPEDGYEMMISKVYLSTVDSVFTLSGLKYASPKTIAAHFEGKQYRSNKISVNINKLDAAGIDYTGIFWNDIITISNISVSDGVLDFLTNKRVPRDPSIIPRMPHELVASLEYALNIGVLNISNSKVSIKELWPLTEELSNLTFSNVETTLININTHATESNPLTITASGNLAEAGKLQVEMILPLRTDLFQFSYEGSLASMSALPLNSHLKIADRTELTSGEIINVTFKVKSEGENTSAGIVPLYRDLKIRTLTASSEEGGIIQDIKSFLGNTFKIRPSNPDDDGEIKSGNIVYKKEADDYFLDIVWFSIRDALGEVVGF